MSEGSTATFVITSYDIDTSNDIRAGVERGVNTRMVLKLDMYGEPDNNFVQTLKKHSNESILTEIYVKALEGG
jgi:hypothetical protein